MPTNENASEQQRPAAEQVDAPLALNKDTLRDLDAKGEGGAELRGGAPAEPATDFCTGSCVCTIRR